MLYHGDNLAILREQLPTASVDLIYLDPPFCSQTDYHMYRSGKRAFSDAWCWDDAAERAWCELSTGRLAQTLEALELLLGKGPLLAYLCMLALRLLELHRVLQPRGSLYLHCSPAVAYSIKVLLDATFGAAQFINEIIWCYRKWTNAARFFQRNHDVIFLYAKVYGEHTFHKLYDAQSPQRQHYRRGWHTNVVGDGIRQLLVYDRTKAAAKLRDGKYDRIIYRDHAPQAAIPDWWTIPVLNSQARERVDYPTQKPLALLVRVVQASSNSGDTVLDPFCGSGTTLAAAQNLGRRWVGIDHHAEAIRICQQRLGSSAPAEGHS